MGEAPIKQGVIQMGVELSKNCNLTNYVPKNDIFQDCKSYLSNQQNLKDIWAHL